MPDLATKRCTQCGEVKPVTQFHRRAASRDGLVPICRSCKAEQQRQRYQLNRDAILSQSREYHQLNRDARLARMREYREEHREAAVARSSTHHARLREQVFDHYGTACACCGSTGRLSIDHIQGDGKQHREQLFGSSPGNASTKFYTWLIRSGFPSGFQTLCLSCNMSKRDGDRCRLSHPEG